MKKRTGELSLWLAVAAVFGALVIGYVIFFTLAARNPVQSVPLAPRPAPTQAP